MQNNIFGTILVIRQLLGPHDFHSMKKYTIIGINGDQKLVAIIFQSIFFYVEENNEIHRGLEQFKFKYMMTVSSFLGELSL